jgi:hypothetical protein
MGERTKEKKKQRKTINKDIFIRETYEVPQRQRVDSLLAEQRASHNETAN